MVVSSGFSVFKSSRWRSEPEMSQTILKAKNEKPRNSRARIPLNVIYCTVKWFSFIVKNAGQNGSNP